MHIQYQTVTLEGIKKTADIMYGIYEMEHSDNAPFKRWVWTDSVFGGVLQKIDTIYFRIKSPIDNLLIVNDSVKFYLKKDILCNLRVVTTNYAELKIKLDEKYKIDNDPRELGILIFGVSIGSSELF